MCIRDRDRAVEVVRSQDAQVHIQYAENSKEYYEISVSDDQVLTMTSASDKAWTDYVGAVSYTHLDVYKRQTLRKGGGWFAYLLL